MKKHSNPFKTLDDMMNTLVCLDADPFLDRDSKAPQELTWAEHVISIQVNKCYDSEVYFTVRVHITLQGLVKLVPLIGLKMGNLIRKEYADGYDVLEVEPSPGLQFFTLIDRGFVI